MAKATGNITIGKTVEKHIAAGTLAPFTVVRFYGPGIPERAQGVDAYVTGYYNNVRGGRTFTVRYADRMGDDALMLGPDAKVGVYVDQADAKADGGF